MNERRMLEMAAKAAGYVVLGYVENYDDFYWRGSSWGLTIEGVNGVWNPLEDDGDALRLAVKLNLLWKPEFAHFLALERFFDQNLDDCLAYRRAIVRAAAAIGEAMP